MSGPFLAFLMIMVWLLGEALLWTGGEDSRTIWLPALLQGFLVWHYFTSPKSILKGSHEEFTYASLYIIFMVTSAKVIFNVINLVILWNLMGWTIAVLLVCLGYILPFHDISEDWVAYLPPIGIVLDFASALIRRPRPKPSLTFMFFPF